MMPEVALPVGMSPEVALPVGMSPAKTVDEMASVIKDAQRIDWKRFIIDSPEKQSN
jgi:hypothetical protein